MALFFTALLGLSAVIIGSFLYDFSQEIPATLYTRFQNFSFVIMFLMSIVVLVSFLLSLFVVSRINIIAQTAQNIMQTGDLSQRIKIKTKADDLSNLAQVLNELLSRLEKLMSGIRDVSDNIAHDLRTPLAHLRQNIEGLKGKPNNNDDIDELLRDADRILDIFNSLLRIVNIEKGKRSLTFSIINMQGLLHDVIELYDPLAEEKSVKLIMRAAEPLIIKGDKNLLFQMFANLLDNALKFAPQNTIISFDVTKNSVVLKDQGIGIPTDERERVFERFYRVEDSRNLEGNGLGLSLVKAIVELHQGTIKLGDNNNGLSVKIDF